MKRLQQGGGSQIPGQPQQSQSAKAQVAQKLLFCQVVLLGSSPDAPSWQLKKKPDIIQIPINILDTKLFRDGTLKKLKKNKIEIHARSVFLQGLLFYSKRKILKIFPNLKNNLNIINNLIRKDNLKLSEASLKLVNSIKNIDKIVIGVKSQKELKQKIKYINKNNNNFNNKKFLDINKYNDTFALNPSKWHN